jgi:cyclopropane fatty-acyl-phospholipid synthase-like methyltransferase
MMADTIWNTKWNHSDLRSEMLALAGRDPSVDPDAVRKFREKKLRDAEWMVKHLELTGDDIVCEIGSGYGVVAKHLSNIVRKIYCVDVSYTYLKQCRKELEGVDNAECISMDVSDLSPLLGRDINKMFAEGVFIHFNVYDIVIYLEQIYKILPKGGLFRFEIMNADLPDIVSHRQFRDHMNGYRRKKETVFGCLFWNSARTVQSIAEQIGFTVKLPLKLDNPTGYVPFWVHKI